jgi:ubiquinone biosynthesis accessory factor UbiK
MQKRNKRTSSEHRVSPHWTGLDGLVYGDAMIDSQFLDDLARRLAGAVPSGLREIQKDVEQNLRSLLQASLSKLDLVTREEFDVQSRVLARTREKLDKLEKTLAALEAQSRQDGPEGNAPPDQTRQ